MWNVYHTNISSKQNFWCIVEVKTISLDVKWVYIYADTTFLLQEEDGKCV